MTKKASSKISLTGQKRFTAHQWIEFFKELLVLHMDSQNQKKDDMVTYNNLVELIKIFSKLSVFLTFFRL